jgi:hypothetical protein
MKGLRIFYSLVLDQVMNTNNTLCSDSKTSMILLGGLITLYLESRR